MKKAIEILRIAHMYLANIDGFSPSTQADMIADARGYIASAISALQPRWETPEQWEKRTGDKYPDRAPVWCADNDDHADPWFLDYYEKAVEDERYYIICAVGGLVPPANWRPKEAGSEKSQ